MLLFFDNDEMFSACLIKLSLLSICALARLLVLVLPLNSKNNTPFVVIAVIINPDKNNAMPSHTAPLFPVCLTPAIQ